MRIQSLALGLVGAFAVACSSGTSGDPTIGDSSADGGTKPSGGSCTCDISYNGVSKSMLCGESACINGEKFACAASGTADQGSCSGEAPAKDSKSPSGRTTQTGGKPPNTPTEGVGHNDATCATPSKTFACGTKGLTCKAASEWCDLSDPKRPDCVDSAGTGSPEASCAQSAPIFGCRCSGDCAGGVSCR